MSTILYAEDDRDARELFAFVLRMENHTVYEARNGAQAVQIARDEPIDLVILDVRMPMMTGFDAARIIAKEMPHIPVAFLSARGMSRDIQKGFACGEMVVDYMVKPISPDEFMTRVNRVLVDVPAQGINIIRAESIAQLVVQPRTI